MQNIDHKILDKLICRLPHRVKVYEFGEAIGVSQGTASKYLGGRIKYVDDAVFGRMSDFFGLQPDELSRIMANGTITEAEDVDMNERVKELEEHIADLRTQLSRTNKLLDRAHDEIDELREQLKTKKSPPHSGVSGSRNASNGV